MEGCCSAAQDQEKSEMLIRSLEKQVEEGSRRIWQDSGLLVHCRVSNLVLMEESSEGKPPLNPHHNIHLDKPEAFLEMWRLM